MARLLPNKMDKTRLKERWSKGTETSKDMHVVRSHVDWDDGVVVTKHKQVDVWIHRATEKEKGWDDA